MGFSDFILKKYGYELKDYVETYSNNLEYRDIMGLNYDSAYVYGFQKNSPFNRCNSYFLGEKDDQIDFCRVKYFKIDNGETGDLFMGDKCEVLIPNVKNIVYKTSRHFNLDTVVFTATDDDYNYFLMAYDFHTLESYCFLVDGSFITARGDKVLYIDDNGLTLYTIKKCPDDPVKLTLEKERSVYNENKEIRSCEEINNIINDEWRDLLDPLDVQVFKMEFVDGTSSILLLDKDFYTVAVTDYYKILNYIKSYIYPPLIDPDVPFPFPDAGLTFKYYKDGEEGEMYIDHDYKITHKVKTLKNDDYSGCLPFEI